MRSSMCGSMYACCLFYSLSNSNSASLTSAGCLLLLPWFSRGLFQCYMAWFDLRKASVPLKIVRAGVRGKWWFLSG